MLAFNKVALWITTDHWNVCNFYFDYHHCQWDTCVKAATKTVFGKNGCAALKCGKTNL